MNAPNTWYQEDDSNELEYQSPRIREQGSFEKLGNNEKKSFRVKKRPVSMNGIHRRRNKRWSW